MSDTQTIRDDYEVRVDATTRFNSAWTPRAYWAGQIVFVDADGRETETGIRSSYSQASDPNRRRTRAKLNIQLGRLRAHRRRTGRRWEIEQREAAETKRFAALVREADPKLLDPLLDRIVDRDEERRKAIHAEIVSMGTRWAAEEIDRLRSELARVKHARQ